MMFKDILKKIFFIQIRIGKDGREFKIYKIKTMSDASDNIYVTTRENDPRIKSWAKWIRRWGIDEIPQIINIIKGDMTFIGPRPLTPQDLSLLTEELIELRKKVKPGWFNPKYILSNPFDHKSMIEIEKKYIKDKLRSHFLTDATYLFLICYNFLFKGIRSR